MKRLAAAALCLVAAVAAAAPIDRHALVSRHNPVLTRIDPHAPLMIGNGNLGFTADITGLQTFPEAYSELAPLLTMAQWAWHAFPNPQQFTEASGFTMVPVPGRGERPFSYFSDFSVVATRPALQWLRENPHRFSLARIGLVLRTADGRPAKPVDLAESRQELDLWTGTLRSRFVFRGEPVVVETRVHPDRDMLLVDIRSPLLTSGIVGVQVRFPGVAQNLNPDPSDWVRSGLHETKVLSQSATALQLQRRLDDTVFRSAISVRDGQIRADGSHQFLVTAQSAHLTLAVSFDRKNAAQPRIAADAGAAVVARFWQRYWLQGGMIDFSGSTDPRATELERRIVLSQYLARINQAGELPPQEEGLFSNSWNGKFHLEMHPWHAAHFASWGRPELLEHSLQWYLQQLPTARAVAQRQGVRGAWWTKMAGPEGRNSPSTINPFIMWQQPHPIYLAELLWRQQQSRATLRRYAALVEETAWLLASWPQPEAGNGRRMLGPPIIPAQENHPPFTTFNPVFETEYFRFGLQTAQRWRERLGKSRVPEWDAVIGNLAAPLVDDGLLRPLESEPDFWSRARSAECSGHASDTACPNRDHPSFMMAYGLIASDRLDVEVIRRTLDATASNWDLRQVWGWDFPMLAMSAARLGEPERAVDWLFADYPNNQWGVSGMTPRMNLDAGAAGNASPRRVAETYFPSNGSLLLAVGMMAAGWTGSSGSAPGFPAKGWNVRVEGIAPLP